MENQINLNPMFITPPKDEAKMQSYDLAYLLEGTFTSFFKGKSIPKKEMDEKDIKPDQQSDEEPGEKTGNKDIEESDNIKRENTNEENKKTIQGFTAENRFLETSKPVKLFILPCSQMLQDNMLDPSGRSTNSTFLLNIIDHLNDENKIASLRSKQQTLNPIAQTTPFTRGVFKAVNIVGLPIMVVLFGLLVLAKRTSRKKKIIKYFGKSQGEK